MATGALHGQHEQDESLQEVVTASSQSLPGEHAPHAGEQIITAHSLPGIDRPSLGIVPEEATADDSVFSSSPFVLPHDIDVASYAALLDLTDLPDDDDAAAAASASPAADGRHNPIESCNWLSYLTWWWVGDLFRLAKQRRLAHSDLQPVPREDEAQQLSARWAAAWQQQLTAQPSRCPSVWRALFSVFGWRFFVRGLPLALVSLAKISQPLLLRQLVLYLEWNDGSVMSSQGPVSLAYGYAIVLFVCCVVQSVVQHQYFFNVYRTGGQSRIVLSTAIYQQALSLQTTHFLSTSTGAMTNLIAVDAGKLEELAIYASYLWDGPLEVVVTLALLLDFIGVSALVGMGFLFSLVPLQSFFSRRFASYRKQAVQWTDLRIKTINEILTGAAVVKMYSWELSLEQVVTAAREQEFRWLRKANFLKSVNMSIFFFSSPVINLLTFITYFHLGHTLSPASIFVTVSLFNACRLPVTNYFPQAIQSLAEARISIRRIQDFMALGFDDQRKRAQESALRQQRQQQQQQTAVRGSVSMSGACFRWDVNSQETAGLYDLTFALPAGRLSAIVGSIGSCKSSLLCAMLGEMTQTAGSASVNASTLAYAAQQAWIFADTLRANILLSRPMNRTRYVRTLYACCLVDDLQLLPAGDLTVIGDKGVNLSGGQKARVALARAVYGDCDLYLFDDCLAALDAIVARRVFLGCMSDDGLLRGKTRVLVTHQTQFLYRAEHIVLLHAGRITAQGAWDEMVAQPVVRSAMHVKGDEGQQQKQQQPQQLTQPLLQQQLTAAVDLSSPHPSFSSSTTALLASPTSAGQAEASDAASLSPKKEKRVDSNSIVSEEVSTVGTVGLQVYAALFRSAGGYLGYAYAFFVLVVLMLTGQGVSITSDRWLAIWSSQSAAAQGELMYEDVYIALVLGAIVLGTLRSDLFFRLVLRGAHSLHARMFSGVLYSGLRWYESSPAGRVLNRFSKDQSIVDELLAITFFDAWQMAFMTLGAIASIASVAPYILAVVAPLVPVFLWLRAHYLNTSREVKRFDAVSRSPVYAYFSSTLNGLSTIRAFNVTRDFASAFIAKMDYNTQAVFTFYTTTRWFGVRLDALCTLLVLATGLLIVGLRDSISAAEAGFALTYSLLLTSLFQWGVRQSAEVENQMTAAERIMQYGDLPPEGIFYPPTHRHTQSAIAPALLLPTSPTSTARLIPGDKQPALDAAVEPKQRLIEPEQGWPREGRIVFDSFCMRYRPGLPLVLRELSFEVRPREKVGVCGTTGAGKSSLFAAIFRLVEGAGGRIVIDDVDTALLPLHTLRSSLSIIPQSPVIFSNTLRMNLDPFSTHPDSALWDALEAVQLRGLVAGLSLKLSTPMSENGSNFSVGECQLLCVARALLKPSRVLLVDEATANVDRRTDALLQQVIRDKFSDRTVLTIAHRLNTIAESDRVLVMKEGRAVEFGPVDELMQIHGGVFRGMMEVATGKDSRPSP